MLLFVTRFRSGQKKSESFDFSCKSSVNLTTIKYLISRTTYQKKESR